MKTKTLRSTTSVATTRGIPTSTLLLAVLAAPIAGVAPSAGQEKSTRLRLPQSLAHEEADPTFVEATLGEEAAVENGQGQVLGELHDCLIDPTSGALLFFVVAPAGEAVETDEAEDTLRLVSFRRFLWNGEERRLSLPVTPEQLGSLPPYEPMPVANEPATGEAEPLLELAGTRILASRVMAGGEPLGSVDRMVLDPNRRAIAFLLVRGEGEGEPIVMPWGALTPEHSEEQGWTFVTERPLTELADAPTLPGDDLQNLEHVEVLEPIYAFHGVTPPATLGS